MGILNIIRAGLIVLLLWENLHCYAGETERWIHSIFPQFRDPTDKEALPHLMDSTCSIFRNQDSFYIVGMNCYRVPKNDSVGFKKVVVYNTQIEELKQGCFESWSGVEDLQIVMNGRLSKVAAGAFRGLEALTSLSIKENILIKFLPSGAFDGLNKLKHLKLQRLGLLSVQNISYAVAPLTTIESLDLSCNIIRSIGANDFSSINSSSLKVLWMIQTNAEYIEEGSFTHLKSLEELYLGGNNLNGSTAALFFSSFISSGLEVLSLQGNVIADNPRPFFDRVAAAGVHHLDLSDIRFGPLRPGFFPVMPKLRTLNLSGIMINELPFGVVDRTIMPNLKHLALARNNFLEILPSVSIPGIVKLDLSDNSQSSPLKANFKLSFSGSPMTSLQELHLKGNEIDILRPGSLSNFPNLKVLNLRDTSLYVLYPNSFEDNPYLLYLDLSHNEFPATETLRGSLFTGLHKLVALDLSNCMITSLQEDSFIHLKSLNFLSLRMNSLKIISPNVFRFTPFIIGLDLRYNALSSWNQQIFPNLKTLVKLFIRNNEITKLTPAMINDFSSVIELDLSNNPLECDCHLYDSLNQVNDREKNFPLNGYANKCFSSDKFKNKTIESFWRFVKDSKECQFMSFTEKLCSAIALCIAICVAIHLFVNIFKMELIYWMYKVRNTFGCLLWRRRRRKGDSIDGYTYDAFISYSHQDKKFVTKIKAVLEGMYDFKLCDYERDFKAGDLITEAVLDSVVCSRMTIMVLSEAFVKSHWCLWELQVAHRRALIFRNADPDSMVIIKLTDIDETLMTKTLKHLMKTRIYLEWDSNVKKERIFWEKLKEVIEYKK